MRGKVTHVFTRAVPVALVALLMAALFAACGSDPTPTPTPRPAAATATPTPVPGLLDQLYAAAQQEGEIVWATTDTEERTTAMIGAFEAKYPGVSVSLITANSAELRERLFLEAQANQITVDVTDPGRDNRVVEEDLAEDLTGHRRGARRRPESGLLGQPHLAEGGCSARAHLQHRQTFSKRVPAVVRGPAGPEPEGRDRPSRTGSRGSSTSPTCLSTADSRPGLWEEDRVAQYLSDVKANELKAQRGNGVVGDLVASGEVSCALEINLSSFENLREDGAPLDIVPVETISVEPVHHFVPKNSPNPNAAKLFAAFLMGPEGRALWTKVRPTSDLGLVEDTPYANLVKSKGSKIVPPGTELNEHFGRLTDRYLEAIGLPTG